MIMNQNIGVFYGPNTISNRPIIIFELEEFHKFDKQICELYNLLNSTIFFKKNDSYKFLENTAKLYRIISSCMFGVLNKHGNIIEQSGYQVVDNKFMIWIEYFDYDSTVNLFEAIISALKEFFFEKNFNLQNLQKILEKSTQRLLKNNSYLNSSLIKQAKKLQIPYFLFADSLPYMQFGWGEKGKLFHYTSSFDDSYHGVSISQNKFFSKEVLKNLGMPIAESILIKNKSHLIEAVNMVGFPCVIKPIQGAGGIGITANIMNFDALMMAYDKAKKSIYGKSSIMLERNIDGFDHRLIVIEGKFMGVIRREPSFVKGDGLSTIKKLISNLNAERLGQQNTLGLKQIKIDQFLVDYLKTKDYLLSDILKEEEKLSLNSIANFSAGGIATDVTHEIHPEIIQMSEIIARATKIQQLGIDYITTDISKENFQTDGAVTEINHFMDAKILSILENSLTVVKSILGVRTGRVPITLIILEDFDIKIMYQWFKSNIKESSVGWVCNDEIHLGQLALRKVNDIGWSSLNLLLKQQTMGSAIVVSTMREIVEKGLPVDSLDNIIIRKDFIPLDWKDVMHKSSNRFTIYENIEDICLNLKIS